MKRHGVIYIVENKLDGMKYVGQTTKTIKERLKGHFSDKKTNSYLHRAMQKYGIENFNIKELFIAFNQDSLNYFETFFINYYSTLRPSGYNLRNGGQQGGTHAEETKLKIGKAHKGKNFNEDYRNKISKAKGFTSIIAVNLTTGEAIEFERTRQLPIAGFNRGIVFDICNGKRKKHKNHTFYYSSDYHANQSGSSKVKKFEHAQRIVGETVNRDKFKKRLTQLEIDYIIEQVNKGKNKYNLALEMNISRRTIYNVLNRIQSNQELPTT